MVRSLEVRVHFVAERVTKVRAGEVVVVVVVVVVEVRHLIGESSVGAESVAVELMNSEGCDVW